MRRWNLPLVWVLALLPSAIFAETMSVQVKHGVVKSTPSFLGENVGDVYYGDRVSALSKTGEWVKIVTPASRGWLHATALTDKRVVLQSGTQRAETGVSSDEIVLAGKGFNAQVESKYRQDNPSLRFDRVDAMERYSLTPEAQQDFARRGQLKL